MYSHYRDWFLFSIIGCLPNLINSFWFSVCTDAMDQNPTDGIESGGKILGWTGQAWRSPIMIYLSISCKTLIKFLRSHFGSYPHEALSLGSAF